MAMTREVILGRLVEHFPSDHPPEEVISILGREVKHDGAEEIEGLLRGQKWIDLQHQAVNLQASNLITLTVEAFVYYLPAFLRSALSDPEEEAATYALYALVPTSHLDVYYESTVKLFLPEQAGVIADTLEYLQKDESFAFLEEEFPPAIALWRMREKEELSATENVDIE